MIKLFLLLYFKWLGSHEQAHEHARVHVYIILLLLLLLFSRRPHQTQPPIIVTLSPVLFPYTSYPCHPIPCTVPIYCLPVSPYPLYPSTETRHLIPYPIQCSTSYTVHSKPQALDLTPLALQSIPHPCTLKPNFKAPQPLRHCPSTSSSFSPFASFASSDPPPTYPYPNHPATSPPPPQTPPPPSGMPAAVCLKEALCARRDAFLRRRAIVVRIYCHTNTHTHAHTHTHTYTYITHICGMRRVQLYWCALVRLQIISPSYTSHNHTTIITGVRADDRTPALLACAPFAVCSQLIDPPHSLHRLSCAGTFSTFRNKILGYHTHTRRRTGIR
jgi:hypothetical protein